MAGYSGYDLPVLHSFVKYYVMLFEKLVHCVFDHCTEKNKTQNSEPLVATVRQCLDGVFWKFSLKIDMVIGEIVDSLGYKK